MMERTESKSKGLRMKLKSLQQVNQTEKPKVKTETPQEVLNVLESIPKQENNHKDVTNDQPHVETKPVLTNNKVTNRCNLLNRMNKDKEPMKLMANVHAQPIQILTPPHDEQPKDIKPEPIQLTYQVKAGDKEKLFKRMASAKQNLNDKENANSMAKKVSERIMGIANMLQNKVNPGMNRQKFLLQDSDVQIVSDEQTNKESYSNVQINSNELSTDVNNEPVDTNKTKEVSTIIMTKPVIKNKKKSKPLFLMK